MNKLVKRLLTGMLAFATILTALPVTAVHASGNQYWTESAERVGYIEHVMNDGSIKSTFNEGHMKVEGETAYCVDINTNFKNGYKTRSDASSRMSSDQIADVALSLEYVKQYTASHTNLNYKQGYLLEQCVVWQRLSEQLGWQCDNVRASYNEISQAVTENYTVTVHVDKNGAMVITQNPTLAPAVQKSKYEPKSQEADVSVSSDTVKDATAFLETFFKLYPTATEKELAYYVKDGVLAPVSGDYVFSELVNPVFTKDGDNLKTSVSVKYLDNKSKMTQISQYELVLHKDDNWKIVE